MRLCLFFLLFIFYLLFSITFPCPIFAQSVSVDVAYTYKITDKDAVNGDLLISEGTNLKKPITPYDNKLFGVLQVNSLFVYRSSALIEKPVSRTGIAKVNVTNINGDIKAGDLLTSSPISGKAMKATQSGYVIGVALASVSKNSKSTIEYDGKSFIIEQIPVAIRIEYAEIDTTKSVNRLIEYLNAALFRTIQDPEKFIQIIRYFAAGVIVVISFLVGFVTFSRSVLSGVEAVGRNPLAKNAIQFSIILNIILTLLIGVLGVVAAFIILRV